MATLRRFPYMLATDASVSVTRWNWRNGAGEWVALPDALPDWDPATPVTVQASVEIDLAGLRSDCRLAPDSTVRVALVWHCPGTGLRGGGSLEDLEMRGAHREVVLHAHIHGMHLADRLNVGVNIILARTGSQSRRLSAKRPGNVLWAKERAVKLEGQAARFPTELRDFARTSWLQPGAAWYVDWSPEDLSQLVLADLRLFVNSSHDAVKLAVSGSGDGEMHRALREMIRYDVARTLIEGALENREFVKSPTAFEDGTIGAAVRRLLATLFVGQEIESLAEYYRRDRFRFEMNLQDRLRIFEGL